MTSAQFRDRLSARALNAGVSVPEAAYSQLEMYFRVLTQWNAKVNLTSLPLQPPADEAFDRLLVEPLAAAPYVPDSAIRWLDIGSGGGSPAIPLKVVRPHARLTLIESKARKTTFLREVVRTLGLQEVTVENARFEQVAKVANPGSVELVTIRAVKNDAAIFSGLHRVLAPGGRAVFFGSTGSGPQIPLEFATVNMVQLGIAAARLTIVAPMFHVEQGD